MNSNYRLCDADVDGMHITWLVVAWLMKYFPTLVQNGFVKRFISPAIIASKGSQNHEFFNMAEFDTWAAARDVSKWKVKYFKGLGTSTQQQARSYFKNLTRYLKTVSVDEQSPEWVSKLFASDRANDRKEWMAEAAPTPLDYSQPDMTVSRGIEGEMFSFAQESLVRAIPGMDGFKEAQRKLLGTSGRGVQLSNRVGVFTGKVLYAALKKCGAKNDEIKIAQLGALNLFGGVHFATTYKPTHFLWETGCLGIDSNPHKTNAPRTPYYGH